MEDKKSKSYIRVIRKSKNNLRIELEDHSIISIPQDELSQWELVENKKEIKKRGRKKKETVESIEETIKETIEELKENEKKITKGKKKVVDKENSDKKKGGRKTRKSINKNIPDKIEVPVNITHSYPNFSKTIVGIDPSYTRTGIAILTSDHHIVFHTLSEQIGKKDFIHTYNSAHTLAIQLQEYLSQYEPFDVVMEYAPPVSSMSPALYCLDALYHFVLHSHIKHLYHPMTLATIIGKRDRTKADSVLRGLSIIEELRQQGWEVDQKRKPCHDCLEALIYVDYYLKNRADNND